MLLVFSQLFVSVVAVGSYYPSGNLPPIYQNVSSQSTTAGTTSAPPYELSSTSLSAILTSASSGSVTKFDSTYSGSSLSLFPISSKISTDSEVISVSPSLVGTFTSSDLSNSSTIGASMTPSFTQPLASTPMPPTEYNVSVSQPGPSVDSTLGLYTSTHATPTNTTAAHASPSPTYLIQTNSTISSSGQSVPLSAYSTGNSRSPIHTTNVTDPSGRPLYGFNSTALTATNTAFSSITLPRLSHNATTSSIYTGTAFISGSGARYTLNSTLTQLSQGASGSARHVSAPAVTGNGSKYTQNSTLTRSLLYTGAASGRPINYNASIGSTTPTAVRPTGSLIFPTGSSGFPGASPSSNAPFQNTSTSQSDEEIVSSRRKTESQCRTESLEWESKFNTITTSGTFSNLWSASSYFSDLLPWPSTEIFTTVTNNQGQKNPRECCGDCKISWLDVTIRYWPEKDANTECLPEIGAQGTFLGEAVSSVMNHVNRIHLDYYQKHPEKDPDDFDKPQGQITSAPLYYTELYRPVLPPSSGLQRRQAPQTIELHLPSIDDLIAEYPDMFGIDGSTVSNSTDNTASAGDSMSSAQPSNSGTGVKSQPYPAGSTELNTSYTYAPIQTDWNNGQYISPSIYIEIPTASAFDLCGQVGTVKFKATTSFHPTDISSVLPKNIQCYGAFLDQGVTELLNACSISTRQFNFGDLPCPPSSLRAWGSSSFIYNTAFPYNPMIGGDAINNWIKGIQSTWGGCTPEYGWDPYTALEPFSGGLVQETGRHGSQPADATPTATALADSTPASPGSGPTAAADPTPAPGLPSTWQGGGWQGPSTPDQAKPHGGKQPPPQNPFVTASPNSGKPGGGSRGNDNGNRPGQGSDPSGTNGAGDNNGPGKKPDSGSNSPPSGGNPGDQTGGQSGGGQPDSGQTGGGQPGGGQPGGGQLGGDHNGDNHGGTGSDGGSSTGNSPGEDAPSGGSSSSGPEAGGSPGGNSPGNHGHSNGGEGSPPISNQDGQAVQTGSPPNQGQGNQHPNGPNVGNQGSPQASPDSGGSGAGANSPDSQVTVQVPSVGNGSPAKQITTLGHTIGLVSPALGAGNPESTQQSPSIGNAFRGKPNKQPDGGVNQVVPPVAPLVTQGHTIVAVPSGNGIIIDGTTLARGEGISRANGAPLVSVLPGGNIVIGTKTVPQAAVPVVTPQSLLGAITPLVTLGRTIAAAPGGGGLAIDGKTIPAGSTLSAANGSPRISVMPDGGVAIGTKTIPKASIPTSSPPSLPDSPLTTLGHTIASDPAGGGIIIDHKTLSPGAHITADDGTPASILPGGNVAFGAQTIPKAAIPTSSPQALTTLGHTIAAAPTKGGVIVDGTTIGPQSVITATGGTPISVQSDGGVVIGTSTIPKAAIPTPSPQPQALTTLGHTVSAAPSGNGVVVDGTTVSPNSAITADSGTPISILPNGNLAIGTKTIPKTALPTTSVQTPLSVLGHSIAASPDGQSVFIDGKPISRGENTTTSSGTPIRVSPNDDVIIGAQTIPSTAIPTLSTPSDTFPYKAPANAAHSVSPDDGVLIDGHLLTIGATSTAKDGTVFSVLTGGRVVINGNTAGTGGLGTGVATRTTLVSGSQSWTSWVEVYPSTTMTGGSGYYTTPAAAEGSRGADGLDKGKDSAAGRRGVKGWGVVLGACGVVMSHCL